MVVKGNAFGVRLGPMGYEVASRTCSQAKPYAAERRQEAATTERKEPGWRPRRERPAAI